MRTNSTNVIKALVLVSVGVALGIAIPGPQPSNAKEVKKVEPPRIGYVNIPKVLRDYKWANVESDKITKIRAEYVGRLEIDRRDAESKLKEMSNKTIVAVYEHICDVIAAMAKELGLDVVEGFPAASRPADEKSPVVAQLMLQTPALIPFYLKPELDFTDEVIERLNSKYPPSK